MKNTELQELDEQIRQKRKIPKEVQYKINRMIFINLIIATVIMTLCTFLLFGCINIEKTKYLVDLRTFSIFSLMITIFIFELAYKKDSGKLALYGVETLFLSVALLSLPYILIYSIFNFTAYVVLISLIFSIYYVSKSIVIQIREQRKYKASLSDINEIIKKGNTIPEEIKEKQAQIQKSEQKNKKKTNLEKKKKESATEKEVKVEKDNKKSDTNKSTKKGKHVK